MIWLTWRQHRAQALAGLIGLGSLGVWLFVSHLGIARVFQSSGLASCLAAGHLDCSSPADVFNTHYQGLQFTVPLFLVVPLLVGLFWGAPLVAREIEHGTYRLVWTQGVTRRRWFSAKVALIAGACAVGAAVFAELVTWWSALFVRVGSDRLTPGVFDVRGIVPIAYVLFALALGILAGTLIRRTVPAMAVTLGAFVGVRAVVSLLVRPHYLPAKTVSMPLFSQATSSADWILRAATVDRAGNVISQGGGVDIGPLLSRCPGMAGLPKKSLIADCAHRLGLHQVITYQPGSRFWAFQGIESAIYIALAAGLIAVAMWTVRRRLA